MAVVDGKSLVLQAVDIVDLIGKTVNLKRRGRSFVGLCPFHQEKTPSFHVRQDRQYFICYGCKASGNAIDFVMRRDRVEFLDALRSLADEYHVELPRLGASRERQAEKRSIYDVNSAAVQLFEKWLLDPATGASARSYLSSRGFDDATLRRFRVGFAPEGWDNLLRSDLSRKFGVPLLMQAGLVKARETGGGHYDAFRNRVIFPIRDESGRTVAFGGRVMPGSEDPAKYLNSPETPLFSKGRTVFGLDLARQAIVAAGTVAIVEGYTDVLMAHQYGVENVVSVLGTALTEQHVNVLRRFAGKIVLLFDPDSAGDLAVNRAVELFLTQPIEIGIATLPDGLDPDEFVMQRGKEGFEALLNSAADALTYQWKRLRSRYGPDDDLTAREKAVADYLELLSDARGTGPVDDLRWGMALRNIEHLTGVPLEALQRRFRRSRRTGSRALAAIKPRPATASGDEFEPVPRNADTIAERWIIGAVLHEPDRWEQVQTVVSPSDFTAPLHRQFAEAIWNHLRDEGPIDLASFCGDWSEKQRMALLEIVEEVEQSQGLDAMLVGALDHVREQRLRRENLALLMAVRQKQASAEEEKKAAFEAFVKKHRPTDLRRIGP